MFDSTDSPVVTGAADGTTRPAADPLSALPPDALIDVIVESERAIAALQARQLQAVAALDTARRDTPLADFAADELAWALTLSPNAARARLEVARALTRRLPATFAALAAGRVDYYRAWSVVDALAGLADDVAGAIEARVLPSAPNQTATQLRRALRAAVLTVDSSGAERRNQLARADRRVGLIAEADGMAAVSVQAPAEDALAIYTCVDGLARAARRRSGETRTLAQLRVDTWADIAREILAAGGWRGLTLTPGRHRTQLHVTVAADTLLGVRHTPGWLAGYGPISAATARRLARDATWRRLLTDPVTGSLLDYASTSHDPGIVLDGHVRARDRTCVAPVCTSPASTADLDHTVPYPRGQTRADNLGVLCRHHHRAKQAGFTLQQPRHGLFRWTTPTGAVHDRPAPALTTPSGAARGRPPPALTAPRLTGTSTQPEPG